jgi:predicted Zn-dependent protease
MQAHALAGEAECLARQDRRNLDKAKALLAAAMVLNKEDNPYVLRAKAWIARVDGQGAQARELFRKALDQAPGGAPELVRELREALAAGR